MTNMPPFSVSRRSPVPVASLLHWTLTSGDSAISCDVVRNSTNTFDVRIVPAWEPAETIQETFVSTVAALECHAAITKRLREGLARDRAWRRTAVPRGLTRAARP
jgi:hypothetical protein